MNSLEVLLIFQLGLSFEKYRLGFKYAPDWEAQGEKNKTKHYSKVFKVFVALRKGRCLIPKSWRTVCIFRVEPGGQEQGLSPATSYSKACSSRPQTSGFTGPNQASQ